jgi:tRNA-specific adenosine deaminase 1
MRSYYYFSEICICRYLLNQLGAEEAKSSLLLERVDDIKFRIRQSIRLHLYVSQAPCGDASMTALAMELGESPEALANRPPISCSDCSTVRGRNQLHLFGRLRTKPGRADAETTDCMSCSDKLALWQRVGLQGALLGRLLDGSVRFHSIVIGDWFDLVALERSFFSRFGQDGNSCDAGRLQLLGTEVPWQFRRQSESDMPANNSLNWFAGEDGVEVLVNGRKVR